MKIKKQSYTQQAAKEFIAIVDENDKVLRKGTRGEADKNNLWKRIVFIIIFNKNGQMLMQQRSLIVKDPLKWTMSAAGHVDYQESYYQAITRETFEEIGAKVRPKKFIKYIFPEIKRHYVGFYAYHDGPFKKNKEVKQLKWVGLSEIQKTLKENPDKLRFTVTFFLTNYMEELEKLVEKAKKH